jgi:hypothetical protein
MLRAISLLLLLSSTSLAAPWQLGTIIESQNAAGRGTVSVELLSSVSGSVPVVLVRSDATEDRLSWSCAPPRCTFQRELPSGVHLRSVTIDIPPAPLLLARSSGERPMTWVLPSMASAPEQQAWRDLAATLCPRCAVTTDVSLASLPTHTVWLVGTANLMRGGAVVSAHRHDLTIDDRGLFLPGARARIRLAKDKLAAIRSEAIDEQRSSVAMTYPHPLNNDAVMVWLRAPVAAIPSLGTSLRAQPDQGWVVWNSEFKAVARGVLEAPIDASLTRVMP